MIQIGDWSMPWPLFWLTCGHLGLTFWNWESFKLWTARAKAAVDYYSRGTAMKEDLARQMQNVKGLLADNDAALARLKHQEVNMHELHEAIRQDLARLEQRRLELQPFWRFP